LIEAGVWAGERPPPRCLADAPPLSVLVEASALIHGLAGAETVLQRFAAVRDYAGIRYWSTTRRQWQPMILASAPLDGDGRERAGDFSVSELASGRTVRFRQVDNTLGAVVYRMWVEAAPADEVRISVVNDEPVRWLLFTLFDAGALRFRHVFRNVGLGLWRYEVEIEVAGPSLLTAGHGASYANRADAIYRHIAGLGPTAAVPLAP
jgi:hypothetical protein